MIANSPRPMQVTVCETMDPLRLKPPFQTNIDEPEKFSQVRKLLQVQKIILDKLQPNQRSFSDPELRNNLVDDFQTFRHFLISHNFHLITNNTASQQITNNSECDTPLIESENSARPTPVPRRSRKKPNERKNSTVTTVSSSIDSKDGDSVSIPESTMTNNTDCCTSGQEETSSLDINQNQSLDVFNAKVEYNYPRNFGKLIPVQVEMPIVKTPIKIKNAKSSFRQFLKMNKITSNKFLSLRNRSHNSNRKSVVDYINPETDCYKPRRPTRDPPATPIIVFRPAAPLPMLESSSSSSSNGNYTYSDTTSELYHDAANLYDVEGIYCSVDDEDNTECSFDGDENRFRNQNNHKENNNHLMNGETKCDQVINSFHSSDNEDYYDDGLCIYEELSSNEGTIYEEYGEEDVIYDNAEFVERNLNNNNNDDDDNSDKKQAKLMKKMEKIMKRFNMTGEEIPVNAGVVKHNSRGGKNDLFVQQGETILILRMENNPPGKWLAKNERSKIGYIDLNNVYLETDSIKAAFQAFQ